MRQLLFVLLLCGACDGSSNVVDAGGDAAKSVPDGFATTRCSSNSDCVGDACDTASCDMLTHLCTLTAKTCADDPADCTIPDTTCAVSTCNAGTWTRMPTSQNAACTTGDGVDGTCQNGECTPPPSCFNASTFTGSPARCGAGNDSDTLANNELGGLGNEVISSYACAPNEAGPEVAFPLAFDPSLTTDIDVTVSLKLTDIHGIPLADQTSVDLDLIVLESTCTSQAKCMNLVGTSGYDGITVGTSAERVSFHADHTKTYYAVIDSNSASQVGTFVLTVESCGVCQAPTTNNLVDCNMTMPVDGNTALGMALLTNYSCGASGSKTAVALSGDELPFLFRDDAGVPRTITASIANASAPATLLALDESEYGDCQPSECIVSAASDNTGSASISFVTNPVDQSTLTPVYERFWLIVDTPSLTDSSFGLEVSCQQVCDAAPTQDFIACGGPTQQASFTGSTIGYTAQFTQYGPSGAPCGGLMGLTGPESVVAFAPAITGTKTYQLELQSKTAGKDLSFAVLDEGTNIDPICDPTATCANATAIAAMSGNGFSGSFTTNVAMNETAAATLSADSGHTYYIIVDGTDLTGADYTITATGTATGAGCGM